MSKDSKLSAPDKIPQAELSQTLQISPLTTPLKFSPSPKDSKKYYHKLRIQEPLKITRRFRVINTPYSQAKPPLLINQFRDAQKISLSRTFNSPNMLEMHHLSHNRIINSIELTFLLASSTSPFNISQAIKRMDSLQNLCINFKKNPQIQSEYIEKLSNQLFNFLNNLRQLRVTFQWCPKLSSTGFIPFCQSISHMASLQCLELDFCDCNGMSNTALETLSKSILMIPELSKFKLSCETISEDFNWVDDEGIIKLSTSLSGIHKLKSLDLNFGRSNQITDSSLQVLCSAVKQMDQIESISFNFGFCMKISDEGAGALFATIENRPSLSKLWLVFHSCVNLEDSSLNKLSRSLESNIQLQSVLLSFGGYSKITKKAVQNLIKSVQKLQKLKLMILVLIQTSSMDDDILVETAEAIKSLKELKELYLDYSCCKFQLKSGIKRIVEAVEAAISLKQLYLNFGYWEDASGKEDLQKLQKLEFLESCQIYFDSYN